MASIRINPIYASVDHEHPYLPLVGGTLTGTLVQNGGNVNIKAATLDRNGDDPSETIWEDNRALNLMDKDGEMVGRVRIGRTPGGVDYLQMLAGNEDGDGNFVYNTFSVAVGKDGTRYYSVSDAPKFRSDLGITPANIGAAAASHGNHVPTTQTADNATYLRNDNTWHKITPADIGAASTNCSGSINKDTYTGDTKRALFIRGTVDNSASALNGHQVSLYIGTESMWLYDGTSPATVWRVSMEGHVHQYLPLAGGTVTGTTNFNTDDYDRDAAANTSGQYGVNVQWTDKNGERAGVLRVDRDAGGIMRMKIGAFTENSSGTEVNNWLQIGVDRDGTRYYSVSDKPKFRSDMEIMGAKSANGYWGIMKPDGSDTSFFRTTQSGIIPYESGGSGQVGTSTWPFSSGYFNAIYLGGTSLNSLFYGATVNRTANYVLAGPTSGSAAHATFRKLVGADLPLATTSVQGAITAAEKAKLNAISTGTTAIIAQNTDTSNKRWRLVLTNADPANLRADVSTNDGSTWSNSADTGSVYFSKSDHSHALTSLTGTLAIAHGGTGKTSAADAWTALGGGSLGKKSSLSPGRSTWSETSGTFSVPAIGHLDGTLPFDVPNGKVMTGLYSIWPSNGDVSLGGFSHNKVRLANTWGTAKSCTVTSKWVCINSSFS